MENYQGESGKLLQLFDTIQTARENGKRILLFSQFTGMLGIIRQKLEEEGQPYFTWMVKLHRKQGLIWLMLLTKGRMIFS